MSKISIPFSIEGHPEFRFSLTLESNSTEAHSLIDSGRNKDTLTVDLRHALQEFRDGRLLEIMAADWKERKR